MEDFLRACGAKGPLQLLVEERDRAAIRWDVPRPFALIGRDPALDLSLDHPAIDARHAYLQVIGGRVFCVDLGSEAGTRLGDVDAYSGWLDHPRGIGIGPYMIRLGPGGREAPGLLPATAADQDPFSSRAKEGDDLPRALLEFRRDGDKPIRWRMRHVLTLIGTSPRCKVRLAAPGVKPFHCSLLRTNRGMWVVNLLGQDEVTVNGSSIRASRLDEGDELRIGEILVRVIYAARDAGEGGGRSSGDDEDSREALLAHPAIGSRELATSHPKAAWLAPGREAASHGHLAGRAPGGEGEMSAALLAMVLDQFGQMQQQFLNQFQQTAMMMFRALGTMHREQMEELREKLDSLHQLGENLQALQAQMTTSVPPIPGRTDQIGVDPTPPLHAHVGRPGREPGGDGEADPTAASVARGAQPVAKNGDDQPRAGVQSMVDDPNISSLNVHEWLIGRLAALEDEQRSRWQKILDMVRGR